ncbi:MAG: hypothetical protein K2Q22_00730, partial [Cytophagales bacterium]|nr:hypothetical protein [Cytophagales bacterium]
MLKNRLVFLLFFAVVHSSFGQLYSNQRMKWLKSNEFFADSLTVIPGSVRIISPISDSLTYK